MWRTALMRYRNGQIVAVRELSSDHWGLLAKVKMISNQKEIAAGYFVEIVKVRKIVGLLCGN